MSAPTRSLKDRRMAFRWFLRLSAAKKSPYINVALEVRLGQTQGISSKYHRTDEARVVTHQGEQRLGCLRSTLADCQGGAVPQAQRETPVEAAKQPRQENRCLVEAAMHRRTSKLARRVQVCGAHHVAHADAPAATLAAVAGAPGDPALLMPASLVRLSISALMATTAELPDIDSAAISGDSVKG